MGELRERAETSNSGIFPKVWLIHRKKNKLLVLIPLEPNKSYQISGKDSNQNQESHIDQRGSYRAQNWVSKNIKSGRVVGQLIKRFLSVLEVPSSIPRTK